MRFRAVWISRKSAERLKAVAFHDSVPRHKSPASLRTILKMFRKDARSRILADAAGIESWISKGMCSWPVVCSIFGRVPSAQSLLLCRCVLAADRRTETKTSMNIAFAFQMSTLFLIKNKKMFCAHCHVSNEPGAASLATLNPADTRSYEARYQSCGVSTVA